MPEANFNQKSSDNMKNSIDDMAMRLFQGGSFNIEFNTDFNHFLPFKTGNKYFGFIVPTPPEKATISNLTYHLFQFVYFDDDGYQTEYYPHIDDIKTIA